jgi:hypothetical protein
MAKLASVLVDDVKGERYHKCSEELHEAYSTVFTWKKRLPGFGDNILNHGG